LASEKLRRVAYVGLTATGDAPGFLLTWISIYEKSIAMIKRDTKSTLSIFHKRINSQGYDEHGVYFGARKSLLWTVVVENPSEEDSERYKFYTDEIVQADTKKEVKEMFPFAKWEDEDEDQEDEDQIEEDLRDEYSLAEILSNFARELAWDIAIETSDSDIFSQHPAITADIFNYYDEEKSEKLKNYMKQNGLFFAEKFDEEESMMLRDAEQVMEEIEFFKDVRESKKEASLSEFEKSIAALISDAKNKCDNFESGTMGELSEFLGKVEEFFSDYRYHGFFNEDIYEGKRSDLLVDCLIELFEKVGEHWSFENDQFEHFFMECADNIDIAISEQDDYWENKIRGRFPKYSTPKTIYKPMALALSEGLNKNPIAPILLESGNKFYVSSVSRILVDILQVELNEFRFAIIHRAHQDSVGFESRWRSTIAGILGVSPEIVKLDEKYAGEKIFGVEVDPVQKISIFANLAKEMKPFLQISLEHWVSPLEWLFQELIDVPSYLKQPCTPTGLCDEKILSTHRLACWGEMPQSKVTDQRIL